MISLIIARTINQNTSKCLSIVDVLNLQNITLSIKSAFEKYLVLNKLEYVDFTPIKNGKHVNDDYPSYLSKYCASIAAATFYPVIKYFEIPAAGCLTFMEVTEKNDCKILGFKDGKNAIFINEDNYEEKFLEFIEDSNNPKWENIANAGREYALQELNNDVAVKDIISLAYQLQWISKIVNINIKIKSKYIWKLYIG